MSKYTRRPVLEEEVCVHAMSRVVQKRLLIDEAGMAELRRILHTQAVFAGMEVITFCFLKNHFHILLHVDPERARMGVTDEELLRRFRVLYGAKRSPSLGANAEELEVILKRGGERADFVRQRLKARMGDVSVFMRELKTRFTFWYNETYQTVGTFWAERFRSVLVEPGSLALKAVAAYIDLNAVRAGLVETPQSYPYCGLGEAAGGRHLARLAYGWLVRRRKAHRSGDDPEPSAVYPDYVAYVNRIVARLRKETASAEGKSPTTTAVEETALVGGYQGKGGAVGSAPWVERLCGPAGVYGFLHQAKAKALEAGSGFEIFAARRSRR